MWFLLSQPRVLPLQVMVPLVVEISAWQWVREDRTSLQMVLMSPLLPSPGAARVLRNSWALWPKERVSAVLARADVLVHKSPW